MEAQAEPWASTVFTRDGHGVRGLRWLAAAVALGLVACSSTGESPPAPTDLASHPAPVPDAPDAAAEAPDLPPEPEKPPTRVLPTSDDSSYLALGGDGYINVWSRMRSVPREVGPRHALAADALAATTLEPLCLGGRWQRVIDPSDKQRRRPANGVVAARILASDAGSAWLLVRGKGELNVYLNGERVLNGEYRFWRAPPIDQWVREVKLQAGRNDLVVHISQSRRMEGALGVRLLGTDLRAAPVLVAPWAQGASCSDESLFSAAVNLSPVKGGFDLEATGTFPGARSRGASTEVLLHAAGARAEGHLDRPVTAAARPGEEPFPIKIASGAAVVEKKAVYRGALHDRIVAASEALAPAPASAAKDGLTWQVDELMQALASGDEDVDWLERRTATLEPMIETLLGGADPYAGLAGTLTRAYRSELDGQLQPYVLHVPEAYDGRTPLPLVVAAHGLHNRPEHALRTVVGRAHRSTDDRVQSARNLPRIPDHGVLILAPWGYGNDGQRLLGEHDVMAALADVRKHYRVDPSKVSMTGYSLGGTVAFTVPLHYPAVFSASGPLCGYPNLMDYNQVTRVPERQPWEDVMLSRRYIVNYARNGKNLPMWIVHGGKDSPERSVVMRQAYRRNGNRHKWDLQPEMGHNVWDYAYERGKMLRWLRRKTRPAAPAEMRFRSGEYRYTKGAWVELLAFSDTKKFAGVDAEWDPDRKRLEVKTRNLDAFALDLSGVLQGLENVPMQVDRTRLTAGGSDKRLVLVREGKGWKRGVPPTLAGKKRPGVSGPLDDALVHPQLIIYGTQREDETPFNKAVAEFHAGVSARAFVSFPVKRDVDVTPEDLANHTLVLIGRPETNAVTAQLIGELPVAFEEGAVTVRGKRHEGRDVGVSLIFPSPRSEREYVVLHAGVDFRGTLASRHLPEMTPDYLVYDSRMTVQHGHTLLHKRAVLDGGFFTDDWK